uniref:Heparan-alpha-glucosaminide N-acetyltransferase catalytic domain-containing protein n=1 Tax=uncultured Desulfobacterium sp. TaxID=201089 RepID=E1YJL7_9BACT|nr:hypothetical protein N47_E49830 [uncultured Desulfobacterium sp.]
MSDVVDITLKTAERIDSIDLLRGLVIVLMCLDHTRTFYTNAPFNPLDLGKTNVALFLTRWITHIAAPAFVFLAGTSAFLSISRSRTKKELSLFLLKRGLFLIIIELTIINWFGWSFSFCMKNITLGVIWAIGWSMISLATLIYLPLWAIATFGTSMIFLHNTLDFLRPNQFQYFDFIWRILHVREHFEYVKGYSFYVLYPLIPWIGVMAAGYAFGAIMLKQQTVERRKTFLTIGLALVVLFILVRGLNSYGDPDHWNIVYNSIEKTIMKDSTAGISVTKSVVDIVFTVLSFLNCHKYPPSLCFLLMTLGPVIILLSLFEHRNFYCSKILIVFGRVPLFFYILHLSVIHFSSGIMKRIFFGPRQEGLIRGFDLPLVYLFWIAVLFFLYLPCRWYADLREKHKKAWMSYL